MPRKAKGSIASAAKPQNRRGKLSKEDIIFIDQYRETMSPAQMGERLRRPAGTIEKYIKDNPTGEGGRIIKNDALKHSLRLRPDWAKWQRQFEDDELKQFEAKYIELVNEQFGEDLFPAEEMQLFQVITLDILMDRLLFEQKLLNSRINEVFLETEVARDEDDIDEVSRLSREHERLTKRSDALTSKHDTYLSKQQNLFKQLKFTRDQRVKVLEGKDRSFLGLLRKLQQEEIAAREGRDMELARLAADKEMKRLSRPHKYADGVVDQPILTPETVIDEEELKELDVAPAPIYDVVVDGGGEGEDGGGIREEDEQSSMGDAASSVDGAGGG